jgi:hypothetical protein
MLPAHTAMFQPRPAALPTATGSSSSSFLRSSNLLGSPDLPSSPSSLYSPSRKRGGSSAAAGPTDPVAGAGTRLRPVGEGMEEEDVFASSLFSQPLLAPASTNPWDAESQRTASSFGLQASGSRKRVAAPAVELMDSDEEEGDHSASFTPAPRTCASTLGSMFDMGALDEDAEGLPQGMEEGRRDRAPTDQGRAGGRHHTATTSTRPDPIRKGVLPSTQPPAADVRCVRACTASGTSLYFPLKPRRTTASAGQAPTIPTPGAGALLGRSIYDMLRAIRNDKRSAEAEAQAPLAEVKAVDVASAAAATSAHPGHGAGRNTLWVEKYAPRKYLDLVGDEVGVPHCTACFASPPPPPHADPCPFHCDMPPPAASG